MTTKILMGIVALLLVSNVFTYIGLSSKDNKILKQENTIASMSAEIDVLKNNLFSCKLTCDAEREAMKYLEEENEKLKETESQTLERLENALQKPSNKDSPNKLPSNVSGLLNNHCNKVYGQPCKSP